MSPEWLALWWVAFVKTVVIETPLYALFLHRRAGGLGRALLLSLGLQMSTHPVLWLAWPAIEDALPYAALVVVAEIVVVLAEAALVAWVIGWRSWRWALLASLVANAVSTVVGLLT